MMNNFCSATFRYSGQNLAMAGGADSVEAFIKEMVGDWFSEYVNANMNNINKVGTPSKNGK